MFKCNNCDRVFEEPIIENTTYESLYGISGDFPNSTPLELEKCPHCDSDNISQLLEDVSEEDLEDFWNWCEEQNGGKEDWDAYAEYLEGDREDD